MDNTIGMLLIISGPSGSGKGTVVKELDPELGYALSISVTTRKPREGEVDGRDYFFASKKEFEELRDKGDLLEHAQFCGNYYGTPKSYVMQQIQKGKVVVLEIEVNGALQVKKLYPEAVSVFLMPQNMAELKHRLCKRNTEDMETIEERLRRAKDELKLVEMYDYLVINDKVERAVSLINSIVIAEYSKPFRNHYTIENFKGVEVSCYDHHTRN